MHPAYTVAHEFTIETRDGKRATIARAGNVFSFDLEKQARAVFAKRADIRSIDIHRVDNEGGKARVTIIHDGNQKRATKTDIMRDVATARGLPVIDIKAATVADDDLRGMPVAAPRARLFNASWRKVGGLTFVRLGRLSLSFCLTRKAI